MALGGMIFIEKFQILEKKVSFCFITFNFLMLLLLHKSNRQSEHSGLCPDTSSLVIYPATPFPHIIVRYLKKYICMNFSLESEISVLLEQ